MLFVDGNITSLSGPGQGKTAINNGTALTVVASDDNDITVTGDILYKTEPVTMTGTVSTIDQLIPANDTGQVLGIFTSAGNVNLANKQSNGNLEIDASIATISQTGSGGIVNTGNSINTLTIVGGRIQNTIQNIGATTRNVLVRPPLPERVRSAVVPFHDDYAGGRCRRHGGGQLEGHAVAQPDQLPMR